LSSSSISSSSSSSITTRIYSKGEISTLPTNDTDLTSAFSQSDYNAVEVDDDNRVSQISNGKYSILLFKNKHTEKNSISITCKMRSDRAPLYSPVYLQIYNKTSLEWETINSNNSSSANTDFYLTANISTNLSNYFDDDYWISYRVYQQAI